MKHEAKHPRPGTIVTKAQRAVKALPDPKAIIAELTDIQQRNRLGVHMFKDFDGFQFPDKSHGWFAETDATIIPQMLSKYHGEYDTKFPLISMSLLPKLIEGQLPISLKPYGYGHYIGAIKAGYLVDLSQTQPNPPAIVRVSTRGLESGNKAYNKQLKLKQPSGTSLDTDGFYRCFGNEEKSTSRTQGLINAMGGDFRKDFSDHQLDALGAAYDETTDEYKRIWKKPSCKDKGTVDNNELLAAAASEHIKAIVVPTEEGLCLNPQRAALNRLAGAIAGINHLKEGNAHTRELPVVMYHVTGPEQGKHTFLAQGKQQLHAMAYEALSELEAYIQRQKSHAKKESFVRENAPQFLAVKELFRYDVTGPKSDRTQQLAAFKKRLDKDTQKLSDTSSPIR